MQPELTVIQKDMLATARLVNAGEGVKTSATPVGDGRRRSWEVGYRAIDRLYYAVVGAKGGSVTRYGETLADAIAIAIGAATMRDSGVEVPD